jgi:hypothetical protein
MYLSPSLLRLDRDSREQISTQELPQYLHNGHVFRRDAIVSP